MRYEIYKLLDLQEAVEEMDTDDRLSFNIAVGSSKTPVQICLRITDSGIYVHEVKGISMGSVL